MGNKKDRDQFPTIMRQFIGESLFGGVEASPYGDEWFVDPESMFFSGSNSKLDPDEEKLAKISAVRWSGGAEWRQMWEAIRPALEASRSLAAPPARVANRSDEGELPPQCQLHARTGDGGGIFATVRNKRPEAVRVRFGFHGYILGGDLPGDSVRAWWASSIGKAVSTLVHSLRRDPEPGTESIPRRSGSL